MINGVLAQDYFTVDPVGPQAHLVVISPVMEYIIGTDILSNYSRIPTLVARSSSYNSRPHKSG